MKSTACAAPCKHGTAHQASGGSRTLQRRPGLTSSHSRATHDRGVQALETYAELTALAPRGAGRVNIREKASLCAHLCAPGRVLCPWAPYDAPGRFIHRAGTACRATGIASEGLPALSGRVPGSGEATAPRWWGGGSELRCATSVKSQPGASYDKTCNCCM